MMKQVRDHKFNENKEINISGELEIEYEDEPMFITQEEEILSCVRVEFNNANQETETEEADYNRLYADEEELASLFQQTKRCPN